jgi:hypothetical protein
VPVGECQCGDVKYWTVEEAEEYLPRLSQLIDLLQVGLVAGPVTGTWTLAPGAEHAEAALSELEEVGVVIRQIDRGLVDFPSLGSDGGTYLLCWQVGEGELAWWHRPEDGFAGRQPLPLP